MLLYYCGDTMAFEAGEISVLVGKSPECDFVVSGAHTSPIHARIEYQEDEFVLIDNSEQDGIYILAEDLGKVHVRAGQVSLRGKGLISLGKPVTEDSTNVIQFVCR